MCFCFGFLRRIRDQVPDAYAEAAKIITTAALKDTKAVTGQMLTAFFLTTSDGGCYCCWFTRIIPKSILNIAMAAMANSRALAVCFCLKALKSNLKMVLKQLAKSWCLSTPQCLEQVQQDVTRCKGSMGGNVLNVEFEPCQNCRPKRWCSRLLSRNRCGDSASCEGSACDSSTSSMFRTLQQLLNSIFWCDLLAPLRCSRWSAGRRKAGRYRAEQWRNWRWGHKELPFAVHFPVFSRNVYCRCLRTPNSFHQDGVKHLKNGPPFWCISTK